MDPERVTSLLERIASALERIERRMEAASIAPAAATSVDLPPMTMPAFPTGQAWRCPIHGSSRIVPAGVSQRTGKAYGAFTVCGEQSCEQRPPRTIGALP